MTDLIRTVLLVGHLGLNALACGAPLLTAVLPLEESVRRRVVAWGLAALLGGLLVGGLSVLLVLAGAAPEYGAAAARLPARAYGMLASEWAFSAVLLVAYAWWSPSRRIWRAARRGLGIVIATNLLYHFPTMMIVLRLLSEQPDLAAEEVVSRPVFLSVLSAPHPLGLTAHFWALALLAAGLLTRRSGSATLGATAAALGAVGLIVSGGWCLLYLPSSPARVLCSFGAPAGWLFFAGVATGVGLLGLLAAEAARPGTARTVWTDAAAGLAVLLMVAAGRLV